MTAAYVYGLLNADDALLYVGRTSNVHRRIIEHQSQAEWWPLVARVDVRTYSTVEAARDAEAEAIRSEKPILNYNLKNPIDRLQRRRPRPGPIADGVALRAIRTMKGVTVSHLAEVVGIHQSHLSNIERGRSKASREVTAALAVALDVDINAITEVAS